VKLQSGILSKKPVKTLFLGKTSQVVKKENPNINNPGSHYNLMVKPQNNLFAIFTIKHWIRICDSINQHDLSAKRYQFDDKDR